MKIDTKKLLPILLVLFVVVFATVFLYKRLNPSSEINVSTDNNLPTMSIVELSKFDGTDNNSPIYIGLNGYVYDITPGREFYTVGGSYHYLAGKDSSVELNLIGGDIIARKYKIIAKLGK